MLLGWFFRRVFREVVREVFREIFRKLFFQSNLLDSKENEIFLLCLTV